MVFRTDTSVHSVVGLALIPGSLQWDRLCSVLVYRISHLPPRIISAPRAESCCILSCLTVAFFGSQVLFIWSENFRGQIIFPLQLRYIPWSAGFQAELMSSDVLLLGLGPVCLHQCKSRYTLGISNVQLGYSEEMLQSTW